MASMTAKRLICTGSAAVLAFSTVLASGLDFQHQLAIGVALAGNGNGHSGGNGGGHGNGNGNGNGHSNALGGNGDGGSGIGKGKGKGKGASIIIVKHEATKHGATASALGALNASHASVTALAHASP